MRSSETTKFFRAAADATSVVSATNYKCPASSQGDECPKWGSTDKSVVARISR